MNFEVKINRKNGIIKHNVNSNYRSPKFFFFRRSSYSVLLCRMVG